MKQNIRFFALFLLLAVFFASVASAATSASSFWKNNGETVTIPKEEYERLQRFEKLDLLLQIADMYYYEDVDHDAMLEGAATGLMQGIGDVYSMYYTAEEMAKFNEETEGVYAGIGCQLLADPTDKLITVTRVFKGSPAEEVGVRAGDKIVYVDDTYYSAYEMDEAVRVMRGTPGESVKVTVLRDLETLDFDIVRNQITINYVEYEILENNIGYVMIYDFLGDAYEGFAEAINAFQSAAISGMIIDLRNNGGGLVDSVVAMCDLILPEGTVVSMRDKYGRETREEIDDQYYSVPMAVLVNGYSASASEIMAGAIRDNHAGTLIGVKTFGKGVVQSSMELQDGSGFKITTARYYTPAGECIHEVGIQPDIEIEMDEEAVTRYGINNLPHDQDNQLQKAIEVLTRGLVEEPAAAEEDAGEEPLPAAA